MVLTPQPSTHLLPSKVVLLTLSSQQQTSQRLPVLVSRAQLPTATESPRSMALAKPYQVLSELLQMLAQSSMERTTTRLTGLRYLVPYSTKSIEQHLAVHLLHSVLLPRSPVQPTSPLTIPVSPQLQRHRSRIPPVELYSPRLSRVPPQP